ncbi:MAG: hypothetical protein OMM_08579 [Candidatus Magnetoglobus multicellularis str. Araruama]|uniref:Uncharacterized protein n=1 Tax=Candidatus Magnetoglobus multicellularis str. Araruama TaxID=890399 RepID=A0A1V1P7J0_9BACT|nr:MAG: hypothetical protein OMM_08579 [Candidatus Magnetoglobus multicellularis str. Araruama]
MDKQINAQKETESRSARRYEYLLSQKQKMDAIDDPEKEIDRLNSSAAVLQNETHVSQSILTVSSDIRKELTEMKHIFQTNTSFYEEELASMKNALEKLLLANK